MNIKEIEEAKGWLSALDIKSEYEATNKELILQHIEQLENKVTKLEEIKDKHLQKIVDALVVKKDLSVEKNNEFKKIIADNIDLTILELRIKLAEEF